MDASVPDKVSADLNRYPAKVQYVRLVQRDSLLDHEIRIGSWRSAVAVCFEDPLCNLFIYCHCGERVSRHDLQADDKLEAVFGRVRRVVLRKGETRRGVCRCTGRLRQDQSDG